MIRRSKPQQGAALVVAMLILSLVTVIAAGMTVQHNFSLRRVSNQLLAQQAYSYLLGVEGIAMRFLMLDLEQDAKLSDPRTDTLAEFWAQEAPPFTVEGGAYTGRIYDLQGRFNLNSLTNGIENTAGATPPQIPYTIEQGIFMRLLQAYNDENFQVTEDQARGITAAVIDWIDENQNPVGFDGCEDDAYYSLPERVGHRASNKPFTSVTELRLICNMPVVLYERIRYDLSVWPAQGTTMLINVNTASEPLLRSIFVYSNDYQRLSTQIDGKKNFQPPPPLTIDDVKSVVEAQAGGFIDFAAAESAGNGIRLWPNGANSTQAPLALYSDFFILESVVQLQDLTQTMSSVISRENGTIKVLVRSTGGL
ncbi:Putative type II secretion system protein K [BD1-7 clade bacterium]|uniref:Type II secretion system protein K n=1 Tax=BD1-7 clade bacterium TaxID=2029982 RepID=A0A5S9R2K9_9GAMM|nr:Putative type II secretion system protein K [BD1-7 clade bacterium]CAA0106286.1 Putative type II secretion system protein K [BD1-7 clade bacterium]CAA0125879.1 Putative type II secretion system protein K [BD1-7 clade bacterium]